MSDSKAAIPTPDESTPEHTSKQSSENKPSPVKRWPLFLLFFIIGSAASFLALNYQTLQQSYNQPIKPIATVQVQQIPAPQSPAVQVVSPQSTAISNEEASLLIQSIGQLTQKIDSLQTELKSLKQQQQLVQETQSNIEHLQLHARLAQIHDPSSHLAQIQRAWQEISLLPSLSPAQHQQAISMFKLAQHQIQQVQKWQQEINVIITSLQPSSYDNIIPNAMPESPDAWLQWIANQFSLKPAQSSQQLSLNRLKQNLLHIKQNMSLELWPHGTTWAQLRAQLQLHLIASKDAKSSSTLTLPEDFSDIKQKLQTLRNTAQQWLKEQ
ncbi:MAG: hypothetical protein R8K49_05565 [Mariprofundaceae bacterium]